MQLRAPTLLLYGTGDIRVDTADSIARMRTYLAAAGNHNVTVRVYAGAPHTLSNTPSLDDTLRWLKQQRFVSSAKQQ